MRSAWRAAGLAGALTLVSGAARSQQLPTYGCHASVNCQPLGFSTIRGNDTFGVGGSAFFGVGFKWDPGFEFFIAAPRDLSLGPKPTPAFRGQLFHLHASLLGSPTTPAPAPTPTPGVAPAAAEPKRD